MLALLAGTWWAPAAFAQNCGGAMDIQVIPDTSPPNQIVFSGAPLGEIVTIVLEPGASATSNPLTLDHVDYALTCANNNDIVPCVNGNDVGQTTGTVPIEFVELVGGTCGVTPATVMQNVLAPGTVSFEFPSQTFAAGEGCTVAFNVRVQDRGTDNSPLTLTGAAQATGSCNGTLEGTGRGSAGVFLRTVPGIELIKEISIDGANWFDANEPGDTPWAAYPSGAQYRLTVTNTGMAVLNDVTINDPTLGISDVSIGSLDIDETAVIDAGDIPALSQAQVCDSDGTFENVASVTGTSDDDGQEVGDSDPANLFCVGLDVQKSADALGKIGDTVDYTVSLINNNGFALQNCVADDSLLGTVFGPNAQLPDGATVLDLERLVQAGDPDTLINEVTLDCDAVGPVNTVALSDADQASTNLFQPSVSVTKTGPSAAKAGDTVTYTVNLANTSSGDTPEAINCTATDPLTNAGEPFAIGFGETTYDYTIPGDATGPIDNSVSVECQVDGFTNVFGDSDNHSVDLFTVGVSVVKTGPATAKAGDTVTYTVNLINDSSGNAPALTCTANDSLAGDLGTLSFGENTYDYAIPGDASGSLVNTVDVNCSVAGVDNQVSASDSHTLELFTAGVSVDKTGPATAKAGDTVTYTVNLTNDSSANAPSLTCTANDSLQGDLGTLPFGETTYDYVIPGDASGSVVNTVDVSCTVEGFDNQVSASDSHTLELFTAGISVDKTGPAIAKAGDTVTYTVTLTNDASPDAPAVSCTAIDSLVGDLGTLSFGETTYDYVIPGDASGSILNTVDVSCSVAGFDNQVAASDSHTVELFTAGVSVDKTGPATAKTGDTVTYTVNLANDSSANAPAVTCTANDSLVGDLGTLPFGETTYDYVIPGDASGSVVNTVDVSCAVEGYDNQVSASDSHTVGLISPAVTLAKSCMPDPVAVGGTIEWSIDVSNTGDAELDCLVNDAEAGIVDEPLLLAAGASDTLTASRIVESGDFPTISNTASVACSVVGFDNSVDAEDTADCEVQQDQGEEICRTPGFWGTHAGTEKRRSSDLAQTAIDAAGGSLSICGQTIDNTNVGNPNSAVEAMCVRVQGDHQRQLARQLTAMSLNCIVSGGTADCAGTSVDSLFDDANAACTIGGAGPQLGPWIDRVDCFNNGGQFDEAAGECRIDDSSPTNCQNRELDESTSIFDSISPLPGPAGSSRACSTANGNGVKVVPAI